MRYKQMDTNMTFAEIDLLNSIEHNSAITRLNHINTVIDWSRIDKHLMKQRALPRFPPGSFIDYFTRDLTAMETADFPWW